MATEPNPAVTTTEVGSQEPQKVTFTDEQQAKIQEITDRAVARAAASTRTQYEATVAELKAQVETLKAVPNKGKTNEATDAEKHEYKTIVEQAKAETERYKQEALTREREVQAARAESQEVRKEVAIANAASKIPFFNLEVVKTLTKSDVVYDAELGQFVVKGSNGQTRYDSSLEKPLSLDAYFAEFAAQNKYLVRSEISSGTGSSETTRTNVTSNGRFAVTDIFGSKSSSSKASQLMKENPDEYRRLRKIAVSEGILAG